jgi:hypothetical protein
VVLVRDSVDHGGEDGGGEADDPDCVGEEGGGEQSEVTVNAISFPRGKRVVRCEVFMNSLLSSQPMCSMHGIILPIKLHNIQLSTWKRGWVILPITEWWQLAALFSICIPSYSTKMLTSMCSCPSNELEFFQSAI